MLLKFVKEKKNENVSFGYKQEQNLMNFLQKLPIITFTEQGTETHFVGDRYIS